MGGKAGKGHDRLFFDSPFSSAAIHFVFVSNDAAQVEKSIQRHNTDSSFEMALLHSENERLRYEDDDKHVHVCLTFAGMRTVAEQASV